MKVYVNLPAGVSIAVTGLRLMEGVTGVA